MYWRRFRVCSIPIPSSSDPSPQESEVFSQWLMARWNEKEALLEDFARNGRFPADESNSSEGEHAVGKSQGAGFIETEVKLAKWYEIINMFAVMGTFVAVVNMLGKLWSTIFGTVAT